MTEAFPLFRATFRDDPALISHATQEELSLLAEPIAGTGDDLLELWSLVAIHLGYEVEIHALGWRLLTACAWITSPVFAIDRAAGMVRTKSGRRYYLGTRDRLQLDDDLRAHLEYALRTWKFMDIQACKA
ncbi:MAG: hypothetical protein ABSC06_05285 [Rhodopila sp.]|jgi:hypothetical protein